MPLLPVKTGFLVVEFNRLIDETSGSLVQIASLLVEVPFLLVERGCLGVYLPRLFLKYRRSPVVSGGFRLIGRCIDKLV